MEDDPWCQVTKVKEQYRRLKEEHQHLQLEYGNLESQYKRTLDDLGACQADCSKSLDQLQQKNRDLEKELFLLRPHILTHETEELIRIKAVEEIEKRYMEEVREHVSQSDAVLIERNELRRENDFLKGELAHTTETVERLKVEYRQRIEAESASLQRQRDALLMEEKSRVSEAVKRASQLDLENRQLSLKMNSLLKENEELTASYQKLQSEANNASRECARKVSGLSGQLSALVAERDCCRQQNDMLSREIASLSEANVRLTSRVHDLERQCGHLQAVLDEMTHKHAMELNNAKLQYLNDRSNIERERTEMRLIMKECDAERDSLRQSLDQKTAGLIDKDRECQQRVALAQEEVIKVKTALEDLISELNGKLAECERRCRSLEDKLENQKNQNHDRVDHIIKEREGLNLEIVGLKEEISRLRNRPEPQPVVITESSHNVGIPSYPQGFTEEMKTKNQVLKERLHCVKTENEDLKIKAADCAEMLRRLEEKNRRLSDFIAEFCRSHTRFQQILESGDMSWNKENGIDGSCLNNNNNNGSNQDVVNMVRFLNEKVSGIEQRTARQLGFIALGAHPQRSPIPVTPAGCPHSGVPNNGHSTEGHLSV